MAWECNSARLCGRVEAPPEFSHRNRGVDYYGFPLVTRRLSGAGDRLNVTLPRRLLAALPAPGERIALTGELRSFNNRSGQGNRLLLFVFAQEFAPPEGADRNEAEPERAARAFLRVFHRKLLESPVGNDLSWSRWFFPVITTAESLHQIDLYAQDCLRYLLTGKRTKARYNARYEDLKALGYRNLVHEYYAFRALGDARETEETHVL